MSSEPTRDPVAEILAEAGLAHDGALGRALESLRALSPADAPEPNGPLADLLALGAGSPPSFVSATPTRAASRAAEAALEKLASPAELAVVRFAPRKRHRGAMISAAVVAGVGLSASGVAALGGVDYSADAPPAAQSVEAPAQSSSLPPGGGADAEQPPLAEPVSQDAPVGTPAAAEAEPRHRRESAHGFERPDRSALEAAATVVADAVREASGRHVAEFQAVVASQQVQELAQDVGQARQWGGEAVAQLAALQDGVKSAVAVAGQQGARHAGPSQSQPVQAAGLTAAPRHLKAAQSGGRL